MTDSNLDHLVSTRLATTNRLLGQIAGVLCICAMLLLIIVWQLAK